MYVCTMRGEKETEEERERERRREGETEREKEIKRKREEWGRERGLISGQSICIYGSVYVKWGRG